MKNTFKVGTSRFIALKDLQPHPLAQRALDLAHAKYIGDNFDPALMGELTVAETKRGRLWIVDGQHRRVGAQQFLDGDDSQQVLCRVIAVDDDAEAARLFLGLNTHKSVRSLDKFFVRVVAKDPTAIGVTAILERYSLTVSRVRAPGTLQAVDACESIFSRQSGAKLLDRVIAVLHQAWGEDVDGYHGQLIRGLGLLLARYGDVIDMPDLVRKLAKKSGPLGIIGRARDLKIAIGGSIAQAVGEHIRGEYNKGRRTGKLEEKAA